MHGEATAQHGGVDVTGSGPSGPGVMAVKTAPESSCLVVTAARTAPESRPRSQVVLLTAGAESPRRTLAHAWRPNCYSGRPTMHVDGPAEASTL